MNTANTPQEKIWTRDMVVDLLAKSNVAVEKAILTIYARQTSDEQATDTASHDNGVGFSGCDAEIFSSFARQIIANKGGRPDGQRLSPKQFAIARKVSSKNGTTTKIARYVGQLLDEIERKGGKVQRSAAKKAAPVPFAIPDPTRAKFPAIDADDFNERWAGFKNEFATLEAERERAAFLSDPDFQAAERKPVQTAAFDKSPYGFTAARVINF